MAVILHSRPNNIGITLSGTGAAFTTPSTALVDGRPQQQAEFTWLSEGSPTTSDYVAIQLDFPAEVVIRGVALLNLTYLRGMGSPLEYEELVFPSGVTLEVHGKRPADGGYTYALGGNALTQDTVDFNDGTTGAWFLFDDGLDAITSLQLRIYNDAGGTFLTADDLVRIGEIFPGLGFTFTDGRLPIRHTYTDEIDDPTQFLESVGNQQFVVERKRARVIDVEVCPTTFANAYTAQQSLSWLRERLVGGKDAAILPALRPAASGESAPIDYGVIQQTAIFGKARNVGRLQAVDNGPYWTLPLTFRESPGN